MTIVMWLEKTAVMWFGMTVLIFDCCLGLE